MSVEDEGFTSDEIARLKDAGEDVQGLLKEIGGDDDSGIARSHDVGDVSKGDGAKAATTGANAATERADAKKGAADSGNVGKADVAGGADSDAAKTGQRDAALAIDDDDDAPSDPKTATVPYQHFQRERKKAREKLAALEKQLGEVNEKFARGDERLRLLSEVMTQPTADETADEDKEPDPNEDIIAWAQWSRREMGRLREATAGTSQTVAESRAEQSMLGNYQRDAAAFIRETPDFPAAYNHLLTVRAAMLQEQGHNEAEIRQILHNEERGLVQRAFQAGKRPAALIYGMARQMGFRPPAAGGGAGNGAGGGNGAANGNGATNGAGNGTQPAAAAAAKPSAVEEVERIARGQAASKSLSDAGGAPQEITVESLAEMSDSQFADFYAKKKGQIDSLLGKRVH